LQPDTLIPDQTNPQAWNRYSYVVNRPTVLADPSGHTYLCGASCEAEDEQQQYSLDDTAALYGVTFNSGWSTTNKAKALLGVMKLAKSMQESYNSYQEGIYQSCLENRSAPTSACSAKSATDVEVYTAVFGNQNFNVNGTGAAWMCGASPTGFFCSSGNNDINPRLVVHELGHTFNSQYDPLRKSPYAVLGSSTTSINTAQGLWVTAFHSVNGEWKWDRSFNGYASNGAPSVYHGSATWDDWNTVHEEFADMFMNWAFDSFTVDQAGYGQARYAWMSSNMGYWLNNMVP